MTCAMPLTTPGIFFLLTTSKSSALLDLLTTVVYFSLTSIPYKVWCTANFMKLNISKTRVISFSRKTITLIFHYKLCHSSITRTDSLKYLGVFIDSKLHFRNHVDYIFSQCIKLLGLVRAITFPFSSIVSLHVILYIN
jgi:hypothetical protein